MQKLRKGPFHRGHSLRWLVKCSELTNPPPDIRLGFLYVAICQGNLKTLLQHSALTWKEEFSLFYPLQSITQSWINDSFQWALGEDLEPRNQKNSLERNLKDPLNYSLIPSQTDLSDAALKDPQYLWALLFFLPSPQKLLSCCRRNCIGPWEIHLGDK